MLYVEVELEIVAASALEEPSVALVTSWKVLEMHHSFSVLILKQHQQTVVADLHF